MNYKKITAVLIESNEIEKALLTSEHRRGRGRALADILSKKCKLQKGVHFYNKIETYTEIESKVLDSNYSVLFFAELHPVDGKVLGSWVLNKEHPPDFYQNDLKEVKSSMEEDDPDEEIDCGGETQDPQRPALHRLLHALGEAVLGLAFGGGVFIGIWELICSTPYRCDDFKGLAYMIFSLIVAILICGAFFTLCRLFRLRLKARFRLDAIVGVITAGVWAWYLLKHL